MLFQTKFWNVGCWNDCQTTLWIMLICSWSRDPLAQSSHLFFHGDLSVSVSISISVSVSLSLSLSLSLSPIRVVWRRGIGMTCRRITTGGRLTQNTPCYDCHTFVTTWYVRVCLQVSLICLCVYIYIYIYYMYICICMCIYIYIHTISIYVCVYL